MERMEAQMQQFFEDREAEKRTIPPCPFCDSNDDVITLRDRLRDADARIEQMRSALQAPEKWQLVPKEPTESMECAPNHADCSTPDAARSAYRAMLAAAPLSPLDVITVTVIEPSSVRGAISKETIHAALAAFQSGDLDWDESDEELMRLALIAADSTR